MALLGLLPQVARATAEEELGAAIAAVNAAALALTLPVVEGEAEEEVRARQQQRRQEVQAALETKKHQVRIPGMWNSCFGSGQR